MPKQFAKVDAVQAMVLTDCRDQLDGYGIDCALKYLNEKLSEHPIKRLLGENTMFAEVKPQRLSHAVPHVALHATNAKLVESIIGHEPCCTVRKVWSA